MMSILDRGGEKGLSLYPLAGGVELEAVALRFFIKSCLMEVLHHRHVDVRAG
jgi:hypothetical protein